MLEAVEEALDAVTLGVHGEVCFARVFDVGTRRDNGFRAGFFDGIDDLLAVVALVGEDVLRGKARQQRLGLRIVRRLPRRQDEAQGIAKTIDGCVYFRRQPAL